MIPDALKTMLVLDASYPIRKLERSDVKLLNAEDLPSCKQFNVKFDALKRFDNVTLFRMAHHGGQTSAVQNKTKMRRLMQDVVKVVKTISGGEGVLVFVYKERFNRNPKRALELELEKAGLNLSQSQIPALNFTAVGGIVPKGAHSMSFTKNAESMPSREFGLAMGLILGRFLVKMQDLHYGYWTDDLSVEMPNLPKAQAQYSDFLLSHVPADVKTILDVGCGAGHTARKLLDRGYQVDCVSPNSILTSIAREVLGSRATLFECRFEDLQTDKRYDLLLFSESFLFMRLDAAIAKALQLLKPGGYLLLSDVFRIVPDGNTAIGGGIHLSEFQDACGRAPFTKLHEIDMTSRIAPTFTLLNDGYIQAIKPAYDLLMARLRARHPWFMKIVLWKFGDKIQRAEAKHFSGRRTAETFTKIKSYRLFLFQHQRPHPR